MKKQLSYALLSLLISNSIYAGTQNQITPVTKETQYLLDMKHTLDQKMIQVADNVYVATGYDASNISMIIGDSGYVLIDSGKFPNNAEVVAEDFKKITDKPLKAVIFTHGHNDHVGGLGAFLKDNTEIQLIGADNLGSENNFDAIAGHSNQRAYMQSGMALPISERIHNGVAKAVKPVSKSVSKDKDPYAPAITKKDLTKVITEPVTNITIDGLDFEITRTYGETDDHLMIHYKQGDVLFTGDLMYRSFPNLSAIRGTKYRDVGKWVESLDAILSKNANALVMGHTRPFTGKETVKKAITNQRDAVKYVFDKTIEGMNIGLTPDEIVQYAKLPNELANDPNLAPLYGNPDWAVRGIFSGYLGWFDGNPTNLDPLPPQEEAKKYIKVMGGEDAVYRLAQQAISDAEYRWALQLSDKLLVVNKENQSYKNIKADALMRLADNTLNTLARNYYNTYALELKSGKR
ncbi:TPA: MBL fold metallo-hydrolase [Vibrio vulnificus]|uniref:alkyl sulfatase dimerization domain-containing protein n=1 Tax=Vibrio vulnificus TaxID=672 RepID=UPI00102BEF84|nr:alkyl sulfatase dimerization domain-containing protein [Vibrio vulnificus]RZR37143.1 MBL fold metallo-hydrolase [Vibrio vulnificus]HAS8171102.1 MBL fold metallo-hydrolase [Vibrio vulnificus]HAS8445212.1 MBL fold metallo-hydrolase [Vibrio vulnificus]HAS8454667.1 MBL fold metallo-hydrolase [Vibrio vulnificus]